MNKSKTFKQYSDEDIQVYFLVDDTGNFIYRYNFTYSKIKAKNVAIYRDKRKDWGEEILLNTWFPDSHLHHLHIYSDCNIVVYIPEKLHKSIPHRKSDLDSMFKINQKVEEWLNGTNG